MNTLKPKLRTIVATALFGAAVLLPLSAAHAAEQVQQIGAISFVSGGVDDASLDRMRAMEGNFNLKMVFALSSGAFLSDVNVTVADAHGNQVLQTKTEGPWLLAKLPAGEYQVVATEGGNQIARKVSVGGGKASRLDFRWTNE